MTSKYRYQLTQKAVDDLDDIVKYIAIDLSNPTAAANFVDVLQENIEEACNFPESGSKVVNEYLPNTGIRKKIVNNYIMYYLPDTQTETIQVLRIIYGHRNLDEILRHLTI